jgi:hypothetical protein
MLPDSYMNWKCWKNRACEAFSFDTIAWEMLGHNFVLKKKEKLVGSI